MSLESFPPLLLVCARYIISGLLLLAAIAIRGDRLPRGRELRAACLSGVLVLGIGNGCLVFAELWIPSGLACLILTISPFWMVGVEALLPGGEPLHPPGILGMLVGLFGASLLFAPDWRTHTFNAGLLSGFLILQLGMAGWSFGSIYQRRQPGSAHPIVIGAVQQLAAGVACLPLVPLGAALMTLVAAFTRSYREAQTYVGLVLLIPTLPLIFASILGLQPRAELMAISANWSTVGSRTIAQSPYAST